MREFTRMAALATLIAVLASDASAQQRPSTAVAEWRAPLPRTEIYGRYNGAELYAVEFLNHNIGWAVGGHSGTHSTMLFNTKDGGKTWERQTLFDGQGGFLYDIGFADANNGWIVGRDRILRTTDGGESWGPVNLPERGAFGAHKLLVLGPDAIIVGTGVENAQILRTLDGGSTWEVIGLEEGAGGGFHTTISGFALVEPSTIFATAGTVHGNKGVLYRSNDGGHSWEIVEEADKPLLDIAFRGRRGVAVGVNIAFWTEDGGDTWRRVAVPDWRLGVDFIDDNTVVAVGRNPQVIISRNGGKTWQTGPGPGPERNYGEVVLADIDAVDPGWWFVAGQTALYHFVDHNHLEPIVTGTLPVPVDVQLPGGGALPRGLYDVTAGHKGDQHVVKLTRKGDVPANTPPPQGLENATTQQKTQRPPTCATPCSVTIPASGVTYERENVGQGTGAAGQDPKSFFFRLTLEPTSNGVAVVARTAVTPPRNVALALAAVGAPKTSDTEARQVAQTTAQRGGGLLGRVRQAAAGDVRGAVAGAVNPQATQQRLRAAKSAPPAVYKLTLRHSLNLFGGTQGARAP